MSYTESPATSESKIAPDQRQRYEEGQRYAEMRTILKRIYKRRPPEPTATERARLALLRAEIAEIKRGGTA
jgi:hypothetical protein